MKNKVSIPKPCSYGWDKMAPTADQKGRHCNACDKVVVDFTAMSTEELQKFLLNYSGEVKVCGHFRTIDTDIKLNWYQNLLLKAYASIETNFRKTVLKTAALFVVGALLGLTGCGVNQATDGDISPIHDHNYAKDSIAADSLARELDKENFHSH